MKDIIIAIDGFSSCGKSTLAKTLSRKLGFTYIDTGAMYRAVTLYFLRYKINLDNASAVAKGLASICIEFRQVNGKSHTFLNGEDVEEAIRTMAVSDFVSPVAAVSAVRKKLVEEQQVLGSKDSVILEGRDIGTVVFPNADLKLFLTADPTVRAKRRYWELRNKGKAIPLEQVVENLKTRDHIDSSRADSPLKQAEDAVLINNTFLNINDQVNLVVNMLKTKGLM